MDLPALSLSAYLCLGARNLPIGPASADRSEGSEKMFNDDFLCVFVLPNCYVWGRFGIENGPGRASEVFKKLLGGHLLLLDPSGARGEPRGPRSSQICSIWDAYFVFKGVISI